MKKHNVTTDTLDADPMECWCDACVYAEKLNKVVLKYHDANLIIDASSVELQEAFVDVEDGRQVIKRFEHGVLEVVDGTALMSDRYPIVEH